MDMAADRPVNLSRCSLFETLPGETLLAFEDSCRERSFRAGEVIVGAEPDARHDVFVVLEGSVHVYRKAPCGDDVALAELGPGSIFGEFAAIDDRPGSATVCAAGETRLAEIPRGAFVDLLSRDPTVALNLLRRLVQIVRGLDEKMVDVHGCQDEAKSIQQTLFLASL
jgi:CRP-like cAMP-binding protein